MTLKHSKKSRKKVGQRAHFGYRRRGSGNRGGATRAIALGISEDPIKGSLIHSVEHES